MLITQFRYFEAGIAPISSNSIHSHILPDLSSDLPSPKHMKKAILSFVLNQQLKMNKLSRILFLKWLPICSGLTSDVYNISTYDFCTLKYTNNNSINNSRMDAIITLIILSDAHLSHVFYHMTDKSNSFDKGSQSHNHYQHIL